jgi:hypothetical protein
VRLRKKYFEPRALFSSINNVFDEVEYTITGIDCCVGFDFTSQKHFPFLGGLFRSGKIKWGIVLILESFSKSINAVNRDSEHQKATNICLAKRKNHI